MLFSIITPIYKAEKYLRECVDSVLNQTFKGEFELILVDDGSPDCCPQICDDYALRDSRVSVVHQKNQGAVAARKNGLSVAQGEYVIILDSDDYLDTILLEKLSQIIAEYHPDVIKYNCRYFSEDSDDVIKNKFNNAYFDQQNISEVLNVVLYDESTPGFNFGGVLYSLWSGAVRRDLLCRYQELVPNNVCMGEDLAVTLPLLLNCKSAYFADYIGYHYRKTEGSMVNSFNPKELSLLKTVVTYLLTYVSEERKNAVSVYALNMLLQHFDKAAEVYDKEEFCSWIQNELDDELHNIASNANIKYQTPKDMAKLLLVRKKWYGLLWRLMK